MTKPSIISGEKTHLIDAKNLANVRRNIIRKKRISDIELQSILENMKNRLKVNREELNANIPEETHAEKQIKTSYDNPFEIHKYIKKDINDYEREIYGTKISDINGRI